MNTSPVMAEATNRATKGLHTKETYTRATIKTAIQEASKEMITSIDSQPLLKQYSLQVFSLTKEETSMLDKMNTQSGTHDCCE